MGFSRFSWDFQDFMDFKDFEDFQLDFHGFGIFKIRRFPLVNIFDHRINYQYKSQQAHGMIVTIKKNKMKKKFKYHKNNV